MAVSNLHQGVIAGAAGAGGYTVDNSIILDDGSSQNLKRTPSSAASERIGTLSMWVKRGVLGTTQRLFSNERDDGAGTAGLIEFQTDDQLRWKTESTGGSNIMVRETTQVFRDPHAWYHIMVTWNSNNTDDTCASVWVNGEQVTDFVTKTNFSSPQDIGWPSTTKPMTIGSLFNGSTYFDGYLSEFVYLDGTASSNATDFGEYDENGVWRPIELDTATLFPNPTITDNSVNFDGTNDYLTRGADLTGLTNGKVGSCSFWFKVEGSNGANLRVMNSASSGGQFLIQRNTDNTIRVRGFNAAASEILTLPSSSTYTADNTWHHCMASWDLANTTGHLYIDGVDDLGSATTTNDTIDWTNGNWYIGSDDTASNKWNGDLAELWWTNEYIDLSQASNRLKFLTADGGPASLGSDGSTPTGTAALIYLSGATSTFHTNDGSGGGFTENGALTDGSTIQGVYGRNSFYLPFSNGGDNQLIDSTDTARTYTWYGTNALITNAEAKFGTASYYSGNAALQNVDAVGIADSDDWRLGGGTGDFTVECWVNFSSVATNQGIVYQWDDSPITGGGGTASNGWHFWINDIASAPKVRFSYYESGSLIVDTQQSTSAFSTGTWYHLAVTREGNDYKLWRDGTQVGSTVTDSSTLPNVSAPLIIGGAGIGATDDLRGYLDEFRISTNARYTGSFTPSTSAFVDDANTSCLLHFDNIEGLGTDAAGSNFLWDYGSPTQSSDTPTNNFANLSSITETLGGAVTLSNGNLNAAGTAAVVWNRNPASIKLYAAAGGKYIFAVKPDAIGGGRGDPWVTNEDYGGGTNPTTQSNAWQCTMDTSSNFIEYDQGTGSTHTMSPAAATGDYMLVAIDLDNLKIWFGRYDASAGVTEWADNGTGWTGDPTDGGTTACATLTGNEFTVGVSLYTGRSCEVDFGQRSDILANITIPTGYGYISSSQIYTNAAPAIEDGTAHFQATAYTGNGSSIEVNQSGNSTFQPDFVWIKNRTNAYRHELFDAVRGVQKYLQSQETDAEGTDSTTLTSFDSDGYSYGSGIWGNTSGNNIVAWQWKGDGTSGSSNTNGSITGGSTVNVNDTAGFSIGTYTGTGSATTVGHGLSAKPELIIVKNRDQADGWSIYHRTTTATDELRFNTASATPNSAIWNSAEPTPTVFTVGTSHSTNASGENYVFYAWRSIPGYSAFGSYTGNGSSDGPLITLDFSPAYFMLKRIDSTSNWHIYTIATEPYNVRDGGFYANTADAEQSWGTRILDIISNGIKFRGSDTNINASGGTYIYAAFAENPFAGTTPAIAR